MKTEKQMREMLVNCRKGETPKGMLFNVDPSIAINACNWASVDYNEARITEYMNYLNECLSIELRTFHNGALASYLTDMVWTFNWMLTDDHSDADCK